MEKEGLTKTTNNNEDYAVAWCGWGYEFGVTTKQMLDTIPKLKELGIHWATLDDGWFNNYGDWGPRLPTFANNAIPDMVKQFHDQGIKVQLWWLPLAVEDGHYGYGGRKYVEADVLKAASRLADSQQRRKTGAHGAQSGDALPCRSRRAGILQAAHDAIHQGLGIRRVEARQYLFGAAVLQPGAPSQIAERFDLCDGRRLQSYFRDDAIAQTRQRDASCPCGTPPTWRGCGIWIRP